MYNSGVERLAGMSLKDPVHVDISADVSSKSDVKKTKRENVTQDDDKTFATPDLLKQRYVIVPSKLRLVTLASFILWKCKVC